VSRGTRNHQENLGLDQHSSTDSVIKNGEYKANSSAARKAKGLVLGVRIATAIMRSK